MPLVFYLVPQQNHASAAKILTQVQKANPPVPVEILIHAKAKEPATDAVPKFLEAYSSHQRVGALLKELHTGKLVDEWNTAVAAAATKPEVVDMGPAVSSFMAVKDENELVRVASFA